MRSSGRTINLCTGFGNDNIAENVNSRESFRFCIRKVVKDTTELSPPPPLPTLLRNQLSGEVSPTSLADWQSPRCRLYVQVDNFQTAGHPRHASES